MPLIDITLKPGYRMRLSGMCPHFTAAEEVTRVLVKHHFAKALPALLVEHAKELGLDPSIPAEGVQVMRHDYDEGDVNVANVWVKLQFNESCAPEEERLRIRDRLYELLVGWFLQEDFEPENFIMDIFWGPTNGKGMVDGVAIEW